MAADFAFVCSYSSVSIGENVQQLFSQVLQMPCGLATAPYGSMEPPASEWGAIAFFRVEDMLFLHPEMRRRSSPAETPSRKAAALFDLPSQDDAVHSAFSKIIDIITSFSGRRVLLVISPSPPSWHDDCRTRDAISAGVSRLRAALAHMPGGNAMTVVSPSWILSHSGSGPYYDAVADLTTHEPYTPGMVAFLAGIACRWMSSLLSPPRKALLLDCDGVLWDGVVGEVGPAGVHVGVGHAAIQRLARAQAEAGVLVCLVTKNEEADVRSVWAAQPASMPLSLDHVLTVCAGWGPKSHSIGQLARRLGLPLDSFVFLDDSALEVGEVQSSCPGVTCLRVPSHNDLLVSWLEWMWACDTAGSVAVWLQEEGEGARAWAPLVPPLTLEASTRSSLYAQHLARRTARETHTSYAHFLDSLALVITVDRMTPDVLPRASQLTVRTNQMNCNKLPLSESELAVMDGEGGTHDVWTVFVRDRFGVYGTVGVVACRRTAVPLSTLLLPPSTLVLQVDVLLLSCRVLARGVEHEIVRHLAGHAERVGATGGLALRWAPSDRNEPMRSFLFGLDPTLHPDPPCRLPLPQALHQARAAMHRWMGEAAGAAQGGRRLAGVVSPSGCLLPCLAPIPATPALCKFGLKCLRLGVDDAHAFGYVHPFLYPPDPSLAPSPLASSVWHAVASALDDEGAAWWGGREGGHADRALLFRAALERVRAVPHRGGYQGAQEVEDVGLVSNPACAKPSKNAGWLHIPLLAARTARLDSSRMTVHDEGEGEGEVGTSPAPSCERVQLDANGALLHAWPSDDGLSRIAVAGGSGGTLDRWMGLLPPPLPTPLPL